MNFYLPTFKCCHWSELNTSFQLSMTNEEHPIHAKTTFVCWVDVFESHSDFRFVCAIHQYLDVFKTTKEQTVITANTFIGIPWID